MDFRNKAINLYKQGKSIDEINKQIGIPLTSYTIENWINEEHINNYKSAIFYLDKKQLKEQNFERKREISLELKQKLKDVLKIVPDDVDMQTKLMYACINLGDFDEAKSIGYKLLETTDSHQLLNGLSIIEEKLKNYDQSIHFIKQILSTEPNNEFYKNKLQRLQNRQGSSYKNKLYAQIATLERDIPKLIEKQINTLNLHGQNVDTEEVSKSVYKEVYSKVCVLSDELLKKYPDEIIAKEKLIKSLYLAEKYDIAKAKGEEFLQTLDKDELIMWYMAKTEDALCNFEAEKAYLEKLLNITHNTAPIQIIKKLNRVNSILEKQPKPENYTEENWEVWINSIQDAFKNNGNVSVDYLEQKLEEAKNYPNYAKSLVCLLDMKSMITEDYEDELETLETYLKTEYSISREDYKEISNAIARIRKYHNIKQVCDSYPRR